jgi:hypothetical protein
MNIERTVTPQTQWEIQICDNAIGAFATHQSFQDEELANQAFATFKVRLVQKSLIELGEK